jgi:hypothetical protein
MIDKKTSWKTSYFSVEGGPTLTGYEIWAINAFDGESAEALEKAYLYGEFNEFNSSYIKLIRKA